LQDDEPVVFTLNGFSVEIKRSVNGYVEVDLQCSELLAELKELREKSAELDELKARYTTALTILERDAKITEQDLDVVENAIDPIETLVKMRAAR
jgi:hypothetical protein